MNKPDLLLTIEKEGFTPKRKGKYYWLSCPFHQDRNPSLKIDTERQNFFCFSCQQHGSAIDFVMALHGLSFRETLQYLKIHEPLRVNSHQQKIKSLVNQFREREKSLKAELTDYYRDFHSITRDLQTWEEVEEFTEDFNLIPLAEYYLEILTSGTDEDKYYLMKRIR